MAIFQSVTNSFKQQLMLGVHDFRPSGGDVFKLALYSPAATLDANTPAYTPTGEVIGPNYTAGGNTLTNLGTALTGQTAFLDFADLTFVNVTLTTRGCLIYNSTPSAADNSNAPLTNPSVCVLDFGGDKQAVAGDVTIVFPTPTATTALIRIT
jgi:hypothetical protein